MIKKTLRAHGAQKTAPQKCSLFPGFFSADFFDISGKLVSGKTGNFFVGLFFAEFFHCGGGVKGVRFGIVALPRDGKKPGDDVLLLKRKSFTENRKRKLVPHGGGVHSAFVNSSIKRANKVAS